MFCLIQIDNIGKKIKYCLSDCEDALSAVNKGYNILNKGDNILYDKKNKIKISSQ
jgi:hypothetical protein